MGGLWQLPEDPFDLDPWLEVLAGSTNPAVRLFAANYANPQEDNRLSAPETGAES